MPHLAGIGNVDNDNAALGIRVISPIPNGVILPPAQDEQNLVVNGGGREGGGRFLLQANIPNQPRISSCGSEVQERISAERQSTGLKLKDDYLSNAALALGW